MNARTLRPPGPFAVEQHETHFRIRLANQKSGTSAPLALVWGEREAALFVASPELLAELERVLSVLVLLEAVEDLSPNAKSLMAKRIESVRALVAKVEGLR